MKLIKRIAAFIIILTVLMCAAPAAFAEEMHAPINCEGKDWDTIFQELLTLNEANPKDVFAGYLNLVTGEEHYWQGDEAVITASMYKVPLNMMVAEAMVTGELNWEAKTKVPYDEVLEATIIDSSNEKAMFMWEMMGNYADYRTRILPYMGADASEKDSNYYQDNTFKPKEIIHCLKTLYESPERFPKIIDTMKRAEPERFFRLREQKFEVAQKYGYVKEWEVSYMNCCGICYTDEPIAIVMFTRGVHNSEQLLTDYCTAMCDYTQLQTAANKVREEEANTALEEELETKQFEELAVPATPTPAPATETGEAAPEKTNPEGKTMMTTICCILVILLALAAIVLIIARRKATKIKPFWMIIAVAVAAFALIISAVGSGAGTIYAKPDGDPGQTADEFLNALTNGNYAAAYSYLRDYATLGLENEPKTEVAKVVYDALHESYGYKINGTCSVDKLEGRQNVSFTYLDLAKTHDDITAMTMTKLAEIVKELPQNQIYDSNNQYKPEVANEAYLRAVKEVMKNASQYYTTEDMTIDLAYSDGRWQVLASPALLKALNGGVAN